MICRAQALPVDPLFERWPAGEVIHVIYDTAYEPESLNPGVDANGVLRNPTRFAPIRDDKGRVVPYLYGGSVEGFRRRNGQQGSTSSGIADRSPMRSSVERYFTR